MGDFNDDLKRPYNGLQNAYHHHLQQLVLKLEQSNFKILPISNPILIPHTTVHDNYLWRHSFYHLQLRWPPLMVFPWLSVPILLHLMQVFQFQTRQSQ